jgi:hypothetical protein
VTQLMNAVIASFFVGLMAFSPEAFGQQALPKRDALGRIVHPPTSLKKAVEAFNAKAATDSIGKDQPPLTEDEVIASIRGWIRKRNPISDEGYKVYQEIAEKRELPEGVYLSPLTGWHGYNDMHFDVWWIDLHIPMGERKGYSYRIRERMIRSRPLTEQERQELEDGQRNRERFLKSKGSLTDRERRELERIQRNRERLLKPEGQR